MSPTLLAIRRPVTMIMVILALVLMGIISYRFLPVQQLPTITPTFVAVSIGYPGASPEEVESQVTLPVENALSGIAGVQQMNGNSSTGSSRVSLQFVQGTDVNTAANDVSASINRIVGRLPSTVGTPTIFKADPNASPIMNLAITGGTLAALYDTATNQLQPSLQQAAGVAAVQVQGGLIPQVNVTINPSALASYAVSVNQITQAMSQQNVSIPGGTTNDNGSVLDVRTDAYFQSVGELRNMVVASPGGTPVTLGQVAAVVQGYAPIDQQTRLNGQDAVGLVITAQSGANVVAVDKAVKAKLAQIEPSLPPGVRVAIVNDQTDYINQSLQAVENDLALAVILPAIVLLLFLHRIRNMFIVVLAIPTSLLSTFTVMYFTGFSLDLISLLALSLLTGILVDDSVVVLENINRHLAMGKHPIRAALDGRHEIALAAVTITLTDVVVYLPVAFTNGLVGQIFREFGVTIVAATLFSLFIGFTLTPLLASRWLKEPLDDEGLASSQGGGPLVRFGRVWERGFHRVRDGYGRLLGRALRSRPLIILVGVAALLASIAFIPLGWLGTEFTPQEDNSQLQVNVQFANGTPLARTEAVVDQVDQEIRAIPGVKQTFANAGARGGFGGGATTGSGGIAVDLLPVGQRPPIVTSLPSALRIGGGQNINVVIQGPDINTLDQLGSQVTQIMRTVPGVVQVRNGSAQTSPELGIQVDRAAAANLGITPQQVGNAIQTAIAGTTVGFLQPSGSTIQTPVVVTVPGGQNMSAQQFAQLTLSTTSGAPVRLDQVAHVVKTQEPAQLSDQNRQLEVSVGANTSGVPLGQVSTNIQKAIRQQLALPPGYSFIMGGATQQQAQVFAPLEAAFGLSVVLVYMLSAALYESLLYPLAVLLSLPLATVGAFAALTVTGNTLNLYSFMGLIMLMGLVAKNAILLVDYTNTLRRRGLERNPALVEAGRTRLRPIIMTTCTMVFAMLPLAVKIGAGSEDRSPMATVLVGGLITSTLLTLFFAPVIYSYVDDFAEYLVRRGWSRPRSAAAFAAALAGDGLGLATPLATNGTTTNHALPAEAVVGERGAVGPG
jgi:HAE1 family hydrophobic/amphiphilic exporter-1